MEIHGFILSKRKNVQILVVDDCLVLAEFFDMFMDAGCLFTMPFYTTSDSFVSYHVCRNFFCVNMGLEEFIFCILFSKHRETLCFLSVVFSPVNLTWSLHHSCTCIRR